MVQHHELRLVWEKHAVAMIDFWGNRLFATSVLFVMRKHEIGFLDGYEIKGIY